MRARPRGWAKGRWATVTGGWRNWAVWVPAIGMEARRAETRNEAQCEAREPGPKGSPLPDGAVAEGCVVGLVGWSGWVWIE